MAYKMTEEHKRKIGQANKIALKGKHCSPKTEFKKGYQMPEEQKRKIGQANTGNKHYKWKGGVNTGTIKKIMLRHGYTEESLRICQICDNVGKSIIHHLNENRRDNRIQNLSVLCYNCHHAIHNPGKSTRFKKGHKKCANSWSFKKGHIPWNKGLRSYKK